MPGLPVIAWDQVGQEAPQLLSTPNTLFQVDTVVITWTEAEWAALHHVFCSSNNVMPYSKRNSNAWDGWQKDDADMPPDRPRNWTFWGYYRLIQISGKNVLLYKSNTHLGRQGINNLEKMINRLITLTKPKLILTTGTAGGAKPEDRLGTVRVVSGGKIYKSRQPQDKYPAYSSNWVARWDVLASQHFSKLLLPIPTTIDGLKSIINQFNKFSGTNYSLSDLDPNGLNFGDTVPQIYNQTGGNAFLLTSSSFVVGVVSGAYKDFTCIEMDDAILFKNCLVSNISFGSLRNISDPVQNDLLPDNIQKGWGSAIYLAYGLYTSYNSALATWAVLAS